MTTPSTDPGIRTFVETVAAAYARYPDVMTVPPIEARAIVEEVRRPWRSGGPAMAVTEDRTVTLPGGPIRLRIQRPDAARGGPALIYLHGGGFTFFSIDTHDRLMREYAARSGLTVIGLDYPLSPEHKFPVALEQIAAFVESLADHGLGVDPARVAIGGDSAGGNLAFAAALLLRDRGRGGLIKALLLNYPGLSPDKSPEAIAAFGGDGAMLSANEAEFFWNNYVRGPEDRCNPLANLMLADPTGMPPALFIVAQNDLLAEQSVAMAARITAASGSAVLRVYPGAVHGFVEAVAVSALAVQAIEDAAHWLADLPALASPVTMAAP